eukprot:PhF_6_TR25466/c0_g1_i1/m.35319
MFTQVFYCLICLFSTTVPIGVAVIYNQDSMGYSGTLTQYTPILDSITMTGYNAWPSGYAHVSNAFSGVVYDGKSSLWLVPRDADRVIQISTIDGSMTGYDAWPSDFDRTKFSKTTFIGGVFDGVSMWMIPGTANQILE